MLKLCVCQNVMDTAVTCSLDLSYMTGMKKCTIALLIELHCRVECWQFAQAKGISKQHIMSSLAIPKGLILVLAVQPLEFICGLKHSQW